ncbi:MAG TPA: twin-arginine translocase subunit TatC, partial [Solirubrobacterales bacterium]|nr:twin-arginine translocase subunit TatC [Solirubrobacterales bacterium]
MARLRPVGFEDRLTLVEHLDELRTRIIISIAAFAVAFGLCMWQNNRLLDIINEPLPDDRVPITFGVAEPFTTTVTVSAYAALVISLPVILYQLYAFVLPALTDRERRVVVPFLLMVPVLFIAGVLFGYFVVLPAATQFLLNFNENQFEIEVRARDYYSFVTTTLALMGLIFQTPIGILSVTRLGIVSPQQLAHNRRYAILVIAIIAMLLPGTDPMTMLLCMIPLVLLFEGSLLLARAFGEPP